MFTQGATFCHCQQNILFDSIRKEIFQLVTFTLRFSWLSQKKYFFGLVLGRLSSMHTYL